MNSIGTFLVVAILLTNLGLALGGDTNHRIQQINDEVEKIKEFQKNHEANVKIYEVTDGGKGLILSEVKQPTSESSEATYYILHDEDGRILSHSEVPTSQSGDWYAESNHYFGRDGKVIMFEFHSSSFNSICTDILRITRRYYFDPGFNLISQTEVFADKDGKPISPKGCDLYGVQKDKPKIHKNFPELTRRIDGDIERFFKERNYGTCIEEKSRFGAGMPFVEAQNACEHYLK